MCTIRVHYSNVHECTKYTVHIEYISSSLFTCFYKILPGIVWHGILKRFALNLAKEYLTRLRSGHGVLDCFVHCLSSRSFSKHTVGPWSQSYEGPQGCFPGLGRIQQDVPNGSAMLTYLLLLVLLLISMICYSLSKYMERIVALDYSMQKYMGADILQSHGIQMGDYLKPF